VAEPAANGERRFARRRVWECRVAPPRLLAHVMSFRSTVATALASDRAVFRRLGVHAQSGYGGDDVAHGRVQHRV
jgi:hypothetical protein